MNILIGTLFIALPVFLDSVELSSPERLPGQVYEPRGPPSTSYARYSSPPSSPSTRQYGKAPHNLPYTYGVNKAVQSLKNIGLTPMRQSGERQSGGRQSGRRQFGRTPQRAGPSEESTAEDKMNLIIYNSVIKDLFYHDNRGFHQIFINDGTLLFDYGGIIVGRVDGDMIAPIFNSAHEMIRIDRNNNNERFIMDEEEARNWGVFERCDEFMQRVKSAYREYNLMDINSNPQQL